MADAESPADTIRRAAELMRERAMVVSPSPWVHVRKAPTAGRGPAYHAVDGAAQPPYTVGVRVCDTGPYDRGDSAAEHITGMHPTVALCIADSWFALAAEMDDYPAVHVPLGIASRPGEPSTVWTHTYNAAREYLRELS